MGAAVIGNGEDVNMDVSRTHKFSGLHRSPVLDPQSKDGVFAYMYSRDNDYLLNGLLPDMNVDAEEVNQDMEIPLRGGQMPVVAQDAGSPIYGEYRYGEQSWKPAEFREKCVIKETDLVNLRKIGTLGELMQAKDLAKKLYDPILERMSNRKEVLRRDALFNSQVIVTGPGNQPITASIPHPAYMNPTTGAVWSNTTTGDALADLQLWVSQFVIDSSYDLSGIWLAHDQLRLIGNQDKFKARAQAGGNTFTGSNEEVRKFTADFLGIGALEEKNNRISYHGYLKASAAAGQPTISVSDVADIVAGDTITIRDITSLAADSWEKKIVQSVNAEANTITFTTNITKVGGFARGSLVKSVMFIIPKNRCLIVGKPSNTYKGIGLENVTYKGIIGNLVSTISRYVDFNNPAPGPFTKIIDLVADGDPPRWEQVFGFRGMIKIDYPDAWMAPTVL